MKKIIRLLTIILAVIISCAPISAYAEKILESGTTYMTFNHHVKTGGVGDYGNSRQYYWISSGMNSTNATYAQRAMDSWVYTTGAIGITTPISFRKTTTKSSSTVDMYQESMFDNNEEVTGRTRFYVNNTEKFPRKGSNWYWCNVYIYNNSIYKDHGAADKQSVFGHEIGHAFGLDHVTNMYRLMCPGIDNRVSLTPTKYECAGINDLY